MAHRRDVAKALLVVEYGVDSALFNLLIHPGIAKDQPTQPIDEIAFPIDVPMQMLAEMSAKFTEWSGQGAVRGEGDQV